MFKSLSKQDRYAQSLSSALVTMKYNAERLSSAAENSSTAAVLDTRTKVKDLKDEVKHLRDESRSMNLYTARQVNLTQGDQAEGRNLAKRMNGKLDSILSSARNLESVSLQKEVVEAALMDLLPRFLESAERIDIRRGGGKCEVAYMSNVLELTRSDVQYVRSKKKTNDGIWKVRPNVSTVALLKRSRDFADCEQMGRN